ncbi:MAG: hypothetical protein H6774_03055 [Pseudomonadales bacterium]|nr:hypothetical protein [Pseudomonadales bacterium]
MKLSKEAISEYQKIYQKEFGEQLSFDEALEKASDFMRLMRVLYQPVTEKKYLEHKK